MLLLISHVQSAELIRDGGSLAVSFIAQDSNTYWLCFPLIQKEINPQQFQRIGYKKPLILNRLTGEEYCISWDHARVMLKEIYSLAKGKDNLYWLQVMLKVANSKGKLPNEIPSDLDSSAA